MALQEFWNGVRSGLYQYGRDAGPEPGGVLRQLSLWALISFVEQFRKEDFAFLLADEQARLTVAVADYLAVARREADASPVGSGNFAATRTAFVKIAELLDFDRYTDSDAYRIGKSIEARILKFRLPELADLRFETGDDHTGKPCLRIWAVFTDAAVTDPEFRRKKTETRQVLESASRLIAPDLWPLVHVRIVSEQAEIAAEGARAA